MNVYVVLMIVTIIYLVFASITDLKERMIYTSPIAFLHMAWSVYFYMNLDISKRELVMVWIIQAAVYLTFYFIKIWGDGDTGLLLIFGDAMLASGVSMGWYGFLIKTLLFFAFGLALSIVAGKAEFHLKSMDLNRHSELAVVPGLAAVMIGLLLEGFVWRYM